LRAAGVEIEIGLLAGEAAALYTAYEPLRQAPPPG
jgi:hypothetical protein